MALYQHQGQRRTAGIRPVRASLLARARQGSAGFAASYGWIDLDHAANAYRRNQLGFTFTYRRIALGHIRSCRHHQLGKMTNGEPGRDAERPWTPRDEEGPRRAPHATAPAWKGNPRRRFREVIVALTSCTALGGCGEGKVLFEDCISQGLAYPNDYYVCPCDNKPDDPDLWTGYVSGWTAACTPDGSECHRFNIGRRGSRWTCLPTAWSEFYPNLSACDPDYERRTACCNFCGQGPSTRTRGCLLAEAGGGQCFDFCSPCLPNAYEPQ